VKQSMCRRALVLTASVVLVLAAAACSSSDGSGSGSSSGSKGGSLGTLTLITGGPLGQTPQLAPLAVAQELDYWSKAGLSVTITGLKGGAAAMQSVVAGHGDIAVADPPTMRQAISQKTPMPLVSFYTWVPVPEYEIAVPSNSPIRSLAELKGKTIGVEDLSEEDATIARQILAGVGNVPDSKVSELPIGSGGTAIQALKSGKVAAYSAGDTGAAGLEGLGYSMRALPLPTAVNDTTAGSFGANKTYFAGHKAQLIAFGIGFSEAVTFCKTNIDACIYLYWKAFPSAAPPNASSDFAAAEKAIKPVVQTRVDKYYAEHGNWGYQNPNGWIANAELLHIPGITTANIKPYYNNSLVPAMSKFNSQAIINAAKAFKIPG
jgi:NitT/TauT family transport system substrate-binding protein